LHDHVQKEIRTMKQLYHPNVVRNLCSFVAGHELWLVMPLLEVGSCASVMGKHHKHGMKNEDLIGSIMYEVLLGLEYLHKDNRIHRDIKAGNILLSKRGSVQIADFGVSGSFQDRQDRKKTFVGTPCWMAPEVLDQV
jgi:serine/threonine-protein kinase OSR1/STK39